MNKPLRITVWSVSSLFVLFAAVVVALPFVIDPNDYRDEIAGVVASKTGRQMKIEGELKLSIFPWFGVSIGKVRLANAAGFAAEDFAAIEAAQVHVKLMPLLQRRVEMDTLTLKGVRVNLAVDKAGRDNWSDMAAKAAHETGEGQQGAETPAGKGDARGASSAQALAALAIGGVRVEDAAVSWRDESHAQAVRVDEINLETGAIDLQSPIPVSLSFDLANEAPEARIHSELSTRIKLALSEQRFELQGLTLEVNGEVEEPMVHGHLTLGGDVSADLSKQRYVVKGLKADAMAKGEPLPRREVKASLSGQADVDLKAETANLQGVRVSAQGVSAELGGQATGLLNGPAFKGRVTVAAFDLRELMKRLAVAMPERADPTTLGKVDAAFDLSGGMTGAAITKLLVHLDDSTLTGRLDVRDFKRPAVRYALKLDGIDADRYLPPPAKSAGKPVVATPATAGAAAAEALPTELLRTLNVQGQAEIGRLKIMKLTAEGITLETRAEGGVIALKPQVAKFYKGRYDGDMRLDARGKVPEIAVDEHLSGVDLEPLVSDFLDKDLLFGQGDVAFKLTAKGLDPEQVTRTLNGQVRLSVTHGGIKGVDLVKMIKDKGLQQGGDMAPDALDQTVFTRLGASGIVRDGVLETKDLAVDSAQLDVSGQGKVDLVHQTQNLRLNAKPQKELAKLLGDLGKETIPVVVGGSFVAPTYKVDIASILKAKADAELKRAEARAKEKAKARVDAEKKKLEQKAREELQNKLKGLFR